jgi:hypothetical protein
LLGLLLWRLILRNLLELHLRFLLGLWLGCLFLRGLILRNLLRVLLGVAISVLTLHLVQQLPDEVVVVFDHLLSYPVPRKRDQSLHTCAQDVQITRIVTI